jgi:hypothetical protein
MRVKFLKKGFSLSLLMVLALYFSACSVMMAETEDVEQKSFDVRPGGTLTMDVTPGSIEIKSGTGNVVKVRVIKKAKASSERKAMELFEKYEIHYDHSGKDVTIESEYERSRGFFSSSRNRLNVKYIVTVPEEYNLDLKTSGGSIKVDEIEGDVKAKTSGGSLKFAQIKGTLWGRTSGGSITLEGCDGNVDVNTSGGSIRIGKVEGEVKAVTSGGSIRVKEVMGSINARTSGGSVSAYISEQPRGNCKLTTSGGSVTIKLAENIKADVDARTSGGRVYTDFPVTVQGKLKKTHLKAEINGGGPELYLRTSGGSIHINKIK